MKSVIVLNPEQPLGLLLNCASILGVILGSNVKDIVGVDTIDADGKLHKGVIHSPLPILQAGSETLKDICKKAKESETIFVAEFSDVAQSCKTYEEYIQKCKSKRSDEFEYLGIVLSGDKKMINRLTGSLKTLR